MLNWLNYLGSRLNESDQVKVFTFGGPDELQEFKSPHPGIQIIRYSNPAGRNAAFRFGSYWIFYGSVLKKLVSWKPETVLYYESISALPAVLYKKHFSKKSRLMVHYHEYTSPKEYETGMLINRWGHVTEKKTFPLYGWISHTNEDRMRLFIDDNKGTIIPNTHILPNYPPRSWENKLSKQTPASSVKIIYVGALSLDTMYTKEFAEWINKQGGKAEWDIYSSNITAEARTYLQSVSGDNIKLKGNVNYFSLPAVLSAYDIGIILYKGHIPNYIFNAPNKLFEYQSRGLDTWYPSGMKTIDNYVTVHQYPKIVSVNFEKLNDINLEEMTDRSGFTHRPFNYYCEEVFSPLINKIREKK